MALSPGPLSVLALLVAVGSHVREGQPPRTAVNVKPNVEDVPSPVVTRKAEAPQSSKETPLPPPRELFPKRQRSSPASPDRNASKPVARIVDRGKQTPRESSQPSRGPEEQRHEVRSVRGTLLELKTNAEGKVVRHLSGEHQGKEILIVGPMLQKWMDLGGPTGLLGAPIEEERNESQSINGTGMRVQKFEGGQLLKHATGPLNGRVFCVYGAIERMWAVELAGTTGRYGSPTSDETEINGVRAQQFENGTLTAP